MGAAPRTARLPAPPGSLRRDVAKRPEPAAGRAPRGRPRHPRGRRHPPPDRHRGAARGPPDARCRVGGKTSGGRTVITLPPLDRLIDRLAVSLVAPPALLWGTDPLHPERAWADFHVLAAVFAVAAAALWGSATVFGRYALAGVGFTTLTALRFTFGLPALAVVLPLIGGLGAFGQYRAADVPIYFELALVPGLIGLLLYYRGLASTPASLATLAELAFPITGVLVNLYLVTPRQSITSWQVAGIAVLWLAIAALDFANARQPARLQPAAAA